MTAEIKEFPKIKEKLAEEKEKKEQEQAWKEAAEAAEEDTLNFLVINKPALSHIITEMYYAVVKKIIKKISFPIPIISKSLYFTKHSLLWKATVIIKIEQIKKD